jgi:hypothetical protein
MVPIIAALQSRIDGVSPGDVSPGEPAYSGTLRRETRSGYYQGSSIMLTIWTDNFSQVR